MESNPASLRFRSFEDMMPYAMVFADLLGCLMDNITCLKEKNSSEVLNAQGDTYWLPLPFNLTDDLPWQPYIDGKIIMEQQLNLFDSGNFAKVPIIIGNNKNETVRGIYAILNFTLEPAAYELIIQLVFGNYSAQVLQAYPPTADSRVALSIFSADFYFICPSMLIAQSVNLYQSDIYVYEFLYQPKVDILNGCWYCQNGFATCHSAEIPYIFNTLKFYPNVGYAPIDYQLASVMQTYWTSFATSTFNNLPPSFIPIPYYNTSTELCLGLNSNITILSHYHSNSCNTINYFIKSQAAGSFNYQQKLISALQELF